jgi:hypothetical protein
MWSSAQIETQIAILQNSQKPQARRDSRWEEYRSAPKVVA